jgi:hypothetical protein
MAMKCVNCGYEFFQQETLQSGFCPACGKSLTVNNEANRAKLPTVHWTQAAGETDATVQLNAQVSSAINIRRIALILILAVFLSIGSTLIGLAISVFFPDMSGAKAILTMWLVFAVLVMIVGLYIIIYQKRLTTF